MTERSIFAAALDIADPTDRAAYLDRACAGDAGLRRHVEDLLAAQGGLGSFLNRPADPARTTTYKPIAEGPGSRVGPYKLLQQIGEGGMGVVYMAEQEQPVRRKVALKIIKPGMDSKQVVARFEVERQALGMMDHPNIARVFDAGTTDSGRPYFVMELVHGVPITEYCDANKLTPRERLELFVPVCQAIQHAHTKGIIHRDVKPSNVLVTMYDDKPVPKVIDFGVAKAVEQRLTERTLFTQYGALVGTFEYMSPEQAEMNAFGVDTRSDVYSLGVLLYELLTGSTPLERQRLRTAAFGEVVRLIKEEDPPKPSMRISTSGTLAKLAAARKTEPSRLSTLVRGELDWIVMRCLEKDRTRRYDGAATLAKDVQRYLVGDAVEACPPTLGYRLMKAYRQHRPAVLIGGAFALLLAAGVVAASVLAVRATDAERTAREDREAAVAAGQAAVAAGQAAAAERDRTRSALDRLTRTTAERRAEQYAVTMTTVPAAWEAGNVAEARRLLGSLRPAEGEEDLRGFEWHFWDRQTHAELSSTRLSVPPLSSDRGQSYGRLWALSGDGGRVAVLRHTTSAADPPARVMLVQVWDAASRKELLSHTIPDDNRDDADFPDCTLSFSRDGKRLVVGAHARVDRPGGGRSWVRYRRQAVDVDGGKVLLDLVEENELSARPTVQVSPDGRTCLTSHSEPGPGFRRATSATLWDLDAGGKEVAKFADVRWVSFSPDGAHVLGWDTPGVSAPKVWEVATGREVRTLDAASVGGWTCSPDGTRLYGVAAAGKDAPGRERVKALDVTTGKELPDIPLPDDRPGTAATASSAFGSFVRAVSPDGSRLAVHRNKPPELDRVEWIVIDTKERRTLFTLEDFQTSATRGGRSLAVCFSPDNKQFILHNHADNSITVHDATTGRRLRTLRGHERRVEAFALTPDGRRLRSVEPDGTLKEWDPAPARPARIECGTRLPLVEGWGLELSGDGRWLASAARVWATAGGASRALGTGPRPGVVPARVGPALPALSGDGSRAAEVRAAAPPGPAMDGDVTVWDTAGGTELFRATGGFDPFACALSPDGTRVAVVRRGEDGTGQVVVFDVGSGRELRSLPLPTGTRVAVRDLQFRPDGERLAGFVVHSPPGQQPDGNRQTTLALWDLTEPTRRTDLDVGSNAVSTPTFKWSPDGRRIVVALSRGDRPLTIYSAETGRVEAALDSARGGRVPFAARPAFSPDGRRVACPVETPQGRFVKVWDAASGGELLAVRSFERGERGLANLPHLVAFSPDGRRLLEYVVKHQNNPGTGVTASNDVIDVTTWDATPRETPKSP